MLGFVLMLCVCVWIVLWCVCVVCDLSCGVVCVCLCGCLRLCVWCCVCVVFGKSNACCFVSSVIYGVRCCVVCV